MKRTLACISLLAVALFAVSCSDSSSPEAAPDINDIDDLVAFYQFDGTLADSGPDGWDAVSAPVATYTEDHNGVEDHALYVDGSATDVWVPGTHTLNITGEITVSAWIKPVISSHAYNCIIDKNLVEAYSMGVHGSTMSGTSGLIFYVTDEHNEVSGAVSYAQNVWTHVACTFDDAADSLKFYVNGALLEARNCDVTLGTAGTELEIGSSHWGDPYKGAIDQLAIFDRALTPDEIEILYELD